jgi:hypothetical protein
LLILRSPYELDGRAEVTEMILPDTAALHGFSKVRMLLPPLDGAFSTCSGSMFTALRTPSGFTL